MNDFLKLAQKNFDEGKFFNTIAYCHKAESEITTAEENLQKNFLLGRAYFEQGDPAAWDYFKICMDTNPNFADAYIFDAKAILKLGNNYEMVVKDLNTAEKLQPDNFEIYLWRGMAYMFLKNFKKAVEDFNRVTELNPNIENIFLQLGMAHNALKNFSVAIENFTKVLEKNPDNADAYKFRAVAYAGLKNFDAAFADFDNAIKNSSTDAYAERAKIFLELGELEKALADVDKYSSELNLFLRAKIYFALGDYEKALADIENYIEHRRELDECWYLAFDDRKDAENFRDLCLKNL